MRRCATLAKVLRRRRVSDWAPSLCAGYSKNMGWRRVSKITKLTHLGGQLLAMDGTTLRTPDNAELRSHFGAQEYASAISSYQQVRGVTVTALPTHLIRDAEFGPYGINEMVYAKTLIPRIPDNSLTVFDKGFLSAELLWTLMAEGENCHFVIPAKSNTSVSFGLFTSSSLNCTGPAWKIALHGGTQLPHPFLRPCHRGILHMAPDWN